MSMPRLVVRATPGLLRVATCDGDRVLRFDIDLHGCASVVDDLFRARVRTVDRALDLAFLDLGVAGEGVLRGREVGAADRKGGIASAVTEGQTILVQGVRDGLPREGKVARFALEPRLLGLRLAYHPGGVPRPARRDPVLKALATQGHFTALADLDGLDPNALRQEAVALTAQWAALAPDGPIGPVLRQGDPLSVALRRAGPAATVVSDETGVLERVKAFGTRFGAAPRLDFRPGRDPFAAPEIAEAWDAATTPTPVLPGGGRLILERCAAFLAVDVDGGGRAAGRDPARHVLDTDLSAADAVARQIRLRGLGGAILVDFIGPNGKAERRLVTDRLRTALRADPESSEVSSMSASGIVGIVRRRTRAALDEILTEPMAPAPSLSYQAAQALAAAVALRAGETVRLSVTPALAAHLSGPFSGPAADLADTLGRTLEWRPGAPPNGAPFALES